MTTESRDEPTRRPLCQSLDVKMKNAVSARLVEFITGVVFRNFGLFVECPAFFCWRLSSGPNTCFKTFLGIKTLNSKWYPTNDKWLVMEYSVRYFLNNASNLCTKYNTLSIIMFSCYRALVIRYCSVKKLYIFPITS